MNTVGLVLSPSKKEDKNCNTIDITTHIWSHVTVQIFTTTLWKSPPIVSVLHGTNIVKSSIAHAVGPAFFVFADIDRIGVKKRQYYQKDQNFTTVKKQHRGVMILIVWIYLAGIILPCFFCCVRSIDQTKWIFVSAHNFSDLPSYARNAYRDIVQG